MFCPNCGSNTDKSSGFCNYCGGRLALAPAKRTSPGKVKAPHLSYDPFPDKKPHTPPFDSYSGSDSSPSKLSGGIIVVITCVIIAVIASACIILKEDSSQSVVTIEGAQISPESVVKAFVKAYNNKDANAIYLLSTASTYNDPSVEEEFLEEVSQMFNVSNDVYTMRINVKSVEKTNSETAIVTYDATVKGLGTSERSEICKKIDGKWYVEMSEFSSRH